MSRVEFAVCPSCRGRGTSSAYLGSFTMEEMYEQGEDFMEDYRAGLYDRACESCKGERVVPQCATDGCRNAVEISVSPWVGAMPQEHCWEHLTEDEESLERMCEIERSEIEYGC